MKKLILLICILVSISIIMYVIFTKANYSKIDENEALAIGEEKYLTFLWMVDGAFNNDRMNEEFVVNGKTITNKEFTCTYKKKTDEACVGNNFEKAFKELFSKSITYQDVYSDGSSYSWIKYENNKYYFTNMTSCDQVRMDLNQKLILKEIGTDKLVFYASDENGHNREFILVKENDEWKVSKAFYHDLCELRYNIG